MIMALSLWPSTTCTGGRTINHLYRLHILIVARRWTIDALNRFGLVNGLVA